MNYFARPKVMDTENGFAFVPEMPKTPVYCNTACCVAGWATLFHPGLQIEARGNIHLEQDGEIYSSYEAFAEAFCLDYDVAYDLCFHGAPHGTPKKAAKAVEKVATALAKEYGYVVVDE